MKTSPTTQLDMQTHTRLLCLNFRRHLKLSPSKFFTRRPLNKYPILLLLFILKYLFTLLNLLLQKYPSQTMADLTLVGLTYEEDYILNSRGLNLFTCKWLPTNKEPKALIFICHGYAMECSITMNSTAIRLAKAGFAVYGIDHEGHGKSDGLQGYISSLDFVVDDCSDYFTDISERKENKGKMRYLLGESMGAAVALLLHRKKPDYWDGAVLAAPMCKLADNLKPSPLVVNILTKLCNFIPTWKIVPTQDIIDVGFKVPEIRHQIKTNPYCYKGKPRLNTGHELLRISLDLEQRLEEVSLPFIILHGEEDRVTDMSASVLLHEKASSWDKTLKTYPKMWHGLLYGETDENINVVFGDMIAWLDERCGLGNSRIEKQLKNECDDLQTK